MSFLSLNWPSVAETNMPNDKDKSSTDTKNTRKRQRENGSQRDEDSPAGGHCCDASKMAEISAKTRQNFRGCGQI